MSDLDALPDFLAPPAPSPSRLHLAEFPRLVHEMTPEMRQLEQQTFEVAFESALERISSGSTLESFCREYHTRLWPGRFRAWIYRNPGRRKAFEVAEALWADCAADELIRIADGLNEDGTISPNDVQRSSLMIAVRKYRMAVANRKKYGEVKKVEQTSTSTIHTSSTSTTATIDLSRLSTEELRRFLIDQAQGIADMRALSHSPSSHDHDHSPSSHDHDHDHSPSGSGSPSPVEQHALDAIEDIDS